MPRQGGGGILPGSSLACFSAIQYSSVSRRIAETRSASLFLRPVPGKIPKHSLMRILKSSLSSSGPTETTDKGVIARERRSPLSNVVCAARIAARAKLPDSATIALLPSMALTMPGSFLPDRMDVRAGEVAC